MKGELSMGIIDGLMGNASETDIEDIKEKYQKLLAPGETIEQAYSLIRDKILLTNIRMILINKNGVSFYPLWKDYAFLHRDSRQS